jgi:hypothetical protein
MYSSKRQQTRSVSKVKGYDVVCLAQEIHLYGDFITASEELLDLGPCSALKGFEQRVIFIVPHLM